MLTLAPEDLSIPERHQYILGAVGPRPIAFASTIDEEGRPNLSPFSFFNFFSSNPPVGIFSPARRGRDNTTKDTYENVKTVPEVVINIVTYDIVHQMNLASSEYETGVNEFEKGGFTMLDSEVIRPYRVKESPVQLECKVNDVVELGDQGAAGNLVISEVVRMHIDEAILDGNGKIDQTKIDLVGRMGGDYYCRAHGDALFEIGKPSPKAPGIGFDQLPEDIRNSKILTGNDLGQLGMIPELPEETEVNEYKLTELSDLFLRHEDQAAQLETSLHEHARELIGKGKVREAWMTLLSFNN